MKKFDVEITETLQRTVSVEAASQEEAERMVTESWNNDDYVLDEPGDQFARASAQCGCPCAVWVQHPFGTRSRCRQEF